MDNEPQDDEYDAKTQHIVDAWEQSRKIGSANNVFEVSPPEPKSNEEMFPVTQEEMEQWRQKSYQQSSWMGANHVEYIAQRGKQYDLDQLIIANMNRRKQ